MRKCVCVCTFVFHPDMNVLNSDRNHYSVFTNRRRELKCYAFQLDVQNIHVHCSVSYIIKQLIKSMAACESLNLNSILVLPYFSLIFLNRL